MGAAPHRRSCTAVMPRRCSPRRRRAGRASVRRPRDARPGGGRARIDARRAPRHGRVAQLRHHRDAPTSGSASFAEVERALRREPASRMRQEPMSSTCRTAPRHSAAVRAMTAARLRPCRGPVRDGAPVVSAARSVDCARRRAASRGRRRRRRRHGTLHTPPPARQGAEVIAIEPSAAMLDDAASTACRHADAMQGTGERMPLAEASVDAVVFAQAWHWVDVPAATAEVARVLQRGGVFGLVWNLRDERVPWVRALGEAMRAGRRPLPRRTCGSRRRRAVRRAGALARRVDARLHARRDPRRCAVAQLLRAAVAAGAGGRPRRRRGGAARRADRGSLRDRRVPATSALSRLGRPWLSLSASSACPTSASPPSSTR